MPERLYLIRRNLESFLGPFTFGEMQQSFRSMNFGLQDEIASNCREWVAFEDIANIRQIYPEIAEFVKGEMLSSWNFSESTVVRKGNGQKARSNGERGRRRKVLTPLNLAIMAALVALAAVFVARNGEQFSQILGLGEPNPQVARGLMIEEKEVPFEKYMDRYRRDIVAQLQSRQGTKEWLPMIRNIAFRREGRVEGLNLQILRGNDPIAAPKECSLLAWKKLWLKSEEEWDGFIRGQSLPNSDWARLLLWDPAWILRRSPVQGWVKPESFYAACLFMAEKALLQIAAEDKAKNDHRENILARLGWLVQMLKREGAGSGHSMAGTLWAISCIESAESSKALGECSPEGELSQDWKALLAGRSHWQELSLIAHRGSQLSPGDLEEIKTILPLLRPKEDYTRFEYDIETHFYQQVLITNGRIQKALDHDD